MSPKQPKLIAAQTTSKRSKLRKKFTLSARLWLSVACPLLALTWMNPWGASSSIWSLLCFFPPLFLPFSFASWLFNTTSYDETKKHEPRNSSWKVIWSCILERKKQRDSETVFSLSCSCAFLPWSEQSWGWQCLLPWASSSCPVERCQEPQMRSPLRHLQGWLELWWLLLLHGCHGRRGSHCWWWGHAPSAVGGVRSLPLPMPLVS